MGDAEMLAAFIAESYAVEGQGEGEYTTNDEELEEADRAGHFRSPPRSRHAAASRRASQRAKSDPAVVCY